MTVVISNQKDEATVVSTSLNSVGFKLENDTILIRIRQRELKLNIDGTFQNMFL